MKRPPTRDIIWLFVATRLLLVMVSYFGYILLTVPKDSQVGVNTTAFFTSWNRWDAANYVRIAQFGYQRVYDTAFLPLFPLLISAIAHLLGSWSYLLVGMILSNAALLGSLFVIYQLAVEVQGEQVAQRTLIYLCIFPTAFFFFAAYNESLFLLLTSGAFLAMRRQRWWLAGILGMLAATTRPAGLFLDVIYLWELWASRESVAAARQRIWLRLLPILLIPLGLIGYCVYCWMTFGNPVAFVTVQSHWARQLAWPWQGIGVSLYELFWNQPFGSFNEVHIILDLGATLGFIVLAILGWRKLRTSYNLWLGMLLFYSLISPALVRHDALQSNQR
ncbi:MAG TPA: mannosyltransferase family protein, partial [Ktedonobacteraceae bacterium]|nr:mannosyltransferase family protein [Ktedonobacteraceae bacterium]